MSYPSIIAAVRFQKPLRKENIHLKLTAPSQKNNVLAFLVCLILFAEIL